LLDYVSDVAGAHALILGTDGADLMCALLRRGCAAATALCRSENIEARSADLVIIPHASPATIEQTLYQARRALTPNGRVVLRVDNDQSGWASFSTVRLLRAQDFCHVRVRRLNGQTLLTAEYRQSFRF
jgi:hypothetical protein